MRRQGFLVQKSIFVPGFMAGAEVTYQGEFNDAGYGKVQEMHGKGIFFARFNQNNGMMTPNDFKYEGYFCQNKFHGFGTMTDLDSEERHEGEFINHFKNGKGTIYKKNGKVINCIFKSNQQTKSLDITDRPDYAFFKNGKPHKVLNENW